RNVAQLKKMWSNMKALQRNAIMNEKQSALATGGGSAEPSVKIDSDISKIVPIVSNIKCSEEMSSRGAKILDDEDGVMQPRLPYKKGPSISAGTKMNNDESRLKVERIKRIMKNEEELAYLKRRHEEEKNKLEIEFLKAKYALEIRAATAAAEKAEFELKQTIENL
ncbi:uncharacterized protein LOC128882238, partial [Hylaeus volcanicus]|uniref:uncharacterized protein LOC128882238 n=1 Tax=Hylaeus volcanicus TaxID=313075 RepID=UPI0023B86E14